MPAGGRENSGGAPLRCSALSWGLRRCRLLLDLPVEDRGIIDSVSYQAGMFFFFFLQREVLNSVLEETNSHLTQSFTIPWCNTPTYALSSYFSSSPAPAFISRSLSPTHSVCLARTLALRGNKPNEWAWLFEWVECSAHSPSVSLHISLATSPLSSLPSRRQISLLPPRAAAKHDNTVHPFTSPGPISLSYSSFSHEPSMSPPHLHHNPASLPHLSPPPLFLSLGLQQLPPAASESHI